MENKTNEKSLAIVDDNIFAKMRRFFIKIFAKKEPIYEEYEEVIEEEKEETPKKLGRLFNYDAEVGDDMPENINEKDKVDENIENAVNYVSEEATKSKASEEREELERKLMNYYASIKNGI